MKKKVLFAAILMIAMAFIPKVWAHDFTVTAPTGQTLYLNIVDGNAVVTYPSNNPSNHTLGVLTIPSMVSGGGVIYNVIGIGDSAFCYCSGLTSVTIPNSVTSIGNYAFQSCSGLTSIDIPNSVISIGEYAFNGCGLTTVSIGTGVTSIGENAFLSGLTSVYFNADSCESLPYGPFDGCSITSITFGDSVRYIPANICSGRNSLTSVTIGNSVISIGDMAFRFCISLTSVTIPNSVTSIGVAAFAYCSGLTSVTIPKSVTSIGVNAFANCSGLTSVVFNSASCSISTPFYGCTNISSFIFGDSVSVILPQICAGLAGLTSVTIPNSVTSIGNSAFGGCSGLTSVTIPNSVTSIGNSAFSGCSGLTSVTIPNSVTSIDNGAFFGCSGLTSLTIPSSVTSIGYSAFSDCSGLTSVVFNAVNCNDFSSYYTSHPFYNCTNITSFTFGDSVSVIPAHICLNLTGLTSVFYNAKNCSAITASYSYDMPFYGCNNLNSFVFGDNVNVIPAKLCYGLTGLTSVTIPNSVTSIGNNAFYGCSGLTSVFFNAVNYYYDFPSIYSNHPFYNCTNITSFTFGDSVRYIPGWACYNMTGLTSITIPNAVTDIGSYAFNGCSGLTSVFFNADSCYSAYAPFSGCANVTSFSFGNNVRNIPGMVCYNMAGLTSVIIPNSVTSIGASAFAYCSGLTSVVFNAESCSGPTSYDNRPFNNCNNLTGFTFGDSVRSIPAYLCADLTGLISVTIPNSVTSINENAFSWSGLTSVTIPNSVSSIGNSAFESCSGLTSVTIGKSVTNVGNLAFAYCGGLTSVIFNADSCGAFPGSVYSTDHPFYNSTNITNFIFGDNVHAIPAFICKNLSGLSSITLPYSLTTIGDGAFYYCSGLDTITIPNRVTYIGNYAFQGCSGLTTMNFNADSCTYMGEESGNYLLTAMYDNPNFITLNIGSNVKIIPDYAFAYCTALQNVNFPASLQYIGNYAFAKTQIGGNLVLGDNVSEVGELAFWGCDSINSVVLPNGLTSTSYGLFYGCDNLTSVTLPDAVNHIGVGSFYGCSSLDSITLPEAIDTISRYAFAGCSGLTKITSQAVMPPAVGVHCFDSVNTSIPLYVPCTSVVDYRADSNWNIFSNITCPGYVESYTVWVTSADTMMGNAMVNGEDSATVEEGDTVTLMATANEGYHFTQWNDGDTNATRTVTVTSDTAFIAYFEADAVVETYTVTVSSADPAIGSVTVNGEASVTVENGETVTLTATANEGYHFVRWNDNDANATRTVTVTEDMNFTAYFEADAVVETYSVTVASADPTMGTVTVNGETSVTVESGETVTLTATANEGYHFVRWNDNNTNATRTITVTEDMSFTAYFEANGGTEGIDDAGSADGLVRVTVRDGRIHVEGAEGKMVRVYDMMGREVLHTTIADEPSALPVGVYLVKVGNLPARKVVVVR